MRSATWCGIGLSLLAGVVLLLPAMRSSRHTYVRGGGESRLDYHELTVGEGISHANLTIFPVYSRFNHDDDSFLTLDRGLKEGVVLVAEVDSTPSAAEAAPFPDPCQPSRPPEEPKYEPSPAPQPDAHQLLVTNRARKPLYLMIGETLAAGEQVGTVAQEIVVPPRTRRMAVEVARVEPGLAADAANAAREQLQPYIKAIEPEVAYTDHVVGVIVAVNGQLATADVFESTPLFRQLWPKLLQGYAVSAAGNLAQDSPACTVADAQRFMDAAHEASLAQTESPRELTAAAGDLLAAPVSAPAMGGPPARLFGAHSVALGN